MSLTAHQTRIAARISAHPDLAGVTVISESDVPNLSEAVRTSVGKMKQCIVVASGGGQQVSEDRAPCLVLQERIVVTVAQIASLAAPTYSPIQIVERLLPWLHGYRADDHPAAPQYLVRSHAPLETEDASGHQITLSVPEAIRSA